MCCKGKILSNASKGRIIMNIFNNKYFKNIFPAIISVIVGLCGNALFSTQTKERFWFTVVLFIIAVLIDLGFISYNVSKTDEVNELICQSDEEIKDAMKALIKMQGKICIMSRDLSWVDCEIEAILISKSQNILIFAEKETQLTKKLQSNGVEIRYYGYLGFEPKTRFTVIRYNGNNPQVAIANTQNSIRKKSKICHAIYQTKKNNGTDEWINSLAIDMISLCRSVCRDSIDEQTNKQKNA